MLVAVILATRNTQLGKFIDRAIGLGSVSTLFYIKYISNFCQKKKSIDFWFLSLKTKLDEKQSIDDNICDETYKEFFFFGNKFNFENI